MLFRLYKRFFLKSLLILPFVLHSYASKAQDCSKSPSCACANTDISPAGIMNDHLHEKGNWMVSYRYQHMNMQNNILVSRQISDNDIYNTYLMSPDKMNMDMHMLMIMYGLSDKITLMVMPQYMVSTMNMNMYGTAVVMNMPGMDPNATMPNSMNIPGFGDTKLYASYGLIQNSRFSLLASAGLSLPTGSVSKLAFSGIYSNIHADYNMQTGSGTFDFLPGISLVAKEPGFDWGIQANGTLRPFYNTNGYRFGNEAVAELWIARKWNSFISNSVRIEGIADGSISGEDNSMYSIMEPSANTRNYGGMKAYIYPGMNFYPGTILTTTTRIRLEYGLPVYQYANGIQLADHSIIRADLDLIF